METDYKKDLDALERACEEVLDAETLKAVVAAKRRIQGEPEREGTSWEWNRFGGCSIADALTGSLVYGRDEECNPDMDALRKGVSK